jgi:uncharacterized membrane protein YqjE
MAEKSAGLMESLKRLASTLTSIVSTRLELLASELQEERLWLTQMSLYALFTIFCFGMALLLLTLFIVVLFWDANRLAVLGGLSILFIVMGTLFANILRVKANSRPKLFSVSIAEFSKDREQLDVDHE